MRLGRLRLIACVSVFSAMTVPAHGGGLRPHPCVAIERDSRLAVARLVRELDLDVEPPVSERRGPPPIFSNRGLKRHAREVADS